MRVALRLLLAAAFWMAVTPAAAQQMLETVVAIRVHGNHDLSDDEVLELAAVTVGDRLAAGGLVAIQERLAASGRFEFVEVLRRTRSLVATDRIVLVVRVREKQGLGRKLLAMPEVAYNEDERFSFGGRVSGKDLLGGEELISIPLSWGGVDRVAFEITRRFESGARAGLVAEARRVHNRHFRVDDERVGVAGFVELPLLPDLRARAHVGTEQVDFGVAVDRQWRFGGGLRLDTRPDVAFPYDAVVLEAAYERIEPSASAGTNRMRLEAAAYRTLIGQAVLAVRGVIDRADGDLAPWNQPTLGGMRSLRGYPAGAFTGDSAAVGTVELRMPFTSAFTVARVGLTAFWDLGGVWTHASSLGATRFRHGVGVGLFLVAPLVRINLDVGSDLKGSTRLHLGLGFRF